MQSALVQRGHLRSQAYPRGWHGHISLRSQILHAPCPSPAVSTALVSHLPVGGREPRVARASPIALLATRLHHKPSHSLRVPAAQATESGHRNGQRSAARASSSGTAATTGSRTEQVFDAVDRLNATAQAGGAGGKTTYEAFKAADEAWFKLRNLPVRKHLTWLGCPGRLGAGGGARKLAV